MKKIIIMVIIAVVVASSLVQAMQAMYPKRLPTQSSVRCEPTGTQVDSLVQLMRELNREIVDPKLIRAGQWIAVPSNADGTYGRMFQVQSWMLGERKIDCLWTMAQSYLRGDLDPVLLVEDLPDPQGLPLIAQNVVNIPPPSPKDKTVTMLVTGIIFACICILLLIYALMRVGYILADGLPWWMYSKNDPRRYQSVIEGGLSADPLQARLQLATLRLKAIHTVEPGKLHKSSGNILRAVLMEFGDRISRKVDLKEGERVHRVTFTDNSIEFFRSACANGFTAGQVSHRGELPDGWTFVPNSQPAATTTPQATVVEEISNTPPLITNGHEPKLAHAIRITKTDKAGGMRSIFIESTDVIGGVDFPSDEESITKIWGPKKN